MTYTTQDEFYRDYRQVEVKVLGGPLSKVFDNSLPVPEDRAYQRYTDTFNRPVTNDPNGHPLLPFQIFGRWVKEYEKYVDIFEAKSVSPPPEFVVGIGKHELNSFKPLNEEVWNLAANDAWMLGGVHSLQEFYYCGASPITWKNILCDTHIVTVTGRELVCLALAGYTEVPTQLGTGFRHGLDAAKARNLSLVDYDAEVSKLKNHAEVMHFLASKTEFEIV